MRNIIVFLVASIFSCNSKKVDNTKIILESCKIIYTTPDFYLDSINYESKVFFSYNVCIKNMSESNLTFINQFDLYDSTLNKPKMKINTRFGYGKIIIRPKDSINIEYISKEKFTTNYNPESIDKEIFNRSDKLIELTNIYLKSGNLFKKINKAPDFFSASENLRKSRVQE